MIRRLAFAVCLLPLPCAAFDVTCPDMATAVQVADCPTDQELVWGFNGYCSDNARAYDKAAPEDEPCVSLDNYRKLKNAALWEAGEFQGYLHCAVPADRHRAAAAPRVSIGKAGTMTRVSCTYDGGQIMSIRTRAACDKTETGASCRE